MSIEQPPGEKYGGVPNPKADDYYERLGIPPTAARADIKKAYEDYRKEQKRLHPDETKINGNEEEMQRVGEAFNELSDRAKREAYDVDHYAKDEKHVRNRRERQEYLTKYERDRNARQPEKEKWTWGEKYDSLEAMLEDLDHWNKLENEHVARYQRYFAQREEQNGGAASAAQAATQTPAAQESTPAWRKGLSALVERYKRMSKLKKFALAVVILELVRGRAGDDMRLMNSIYEEIVGHSGTTLTENVENQQQSKAEQQPAQPDVSKEVPPEESGASGPSDSQEQEHVSPVQPEEAPQASRQESSNEWMGRDHQDDNALSSGVRTAPEGSQGESAPLQESETKPAPETPTMPEKLEESRVTINGAEIPYFVGGGTSQTAFEARYNAAYAYAEKHRGSRVIFDATGPYLKDDGEPRPHMGSFLIGEDGRPQTNFELKDQRGNTILPYAPGSTQ